MNARGCCDGECTGACDGYAPTVDRAGRCADELRASGLASPRWCERCGLGPCERAKPNPAPPCARCRALTTLACGGPLCPNRKRSQPAPPPTPTGDLPGDRL